MNKQVDHIIVGQGLAGSILGLTLLSRGKSILVIDNARPATASKVAAGLYNPIVFKRLLKSWKADELLSHMDRFYPEAESLLGENFYFSKRILKPFAEEQEKVLWLKKADEEIGRYLSKSIITDDLNGIVQNPLGMSEVLQGGNLDTLKFLSSSKKYFEDGGIFREEEFEYDKITFKEGLVLYKDVSASKIIFCEGSKATENPYFRALPFKLTKGETLIIKLPAEHVIPAEMVVNKAVFILPLGANTYKVGATYEWEDLSEKVTEKGREDLAEKLKKVLKVPFEIIDQQAGIRPTVSDRRPLIGLHQEHPQLAIFNGMGTKGVMLAPFFAGQFADYLNKKGKLDEEVDISRFRKLGFGRRK